MLVADLVKSTWEGHPDYSDLCKAKEKISAIANFVNEQVIYSSRAELTMLQKRLVENLHKVGDVIAIIDGLEDKVRMSTFSSLATEKINVTDKEICQRRKSHNLG